MLEKIAEIICEYVYIDPAEITEQANLRTDIGLSSLDLMSVASDMENTFGVRSPRGRYSPPRQSGILSPAWADKQM